MTPLVDARHMLPPLPANHDPSRRSLSCAECRRPVPAGTVRHRACAARAPWATPEGVTR